MINNMSLTTLLTENSSQLTPLRPHLLLDCALAVVPLLIRVSLHVRQQLMLQLKVVI